MNAVFFLVSPEADPAQHLRILAQIDVPWEGEVGGAVVLEVEGASVDVAFDHAEIIGTVMKRLRGKLDYSPVGYELLPSEFTLLDLQRVHESILGVKVNKDSFRRRMLASGELEATGREPYVGCSIEAYLRRGIARLNERQFEAAEEDFLRVADRPPGI